MKKIYFAAFLSLFIFNAYSQQAFWTETFGTGCNSGQGASVVATPSNGAWAITSFSLPFMNGPDANEWFISSSEQGQPVNICGGITCGGSNNRTLHIGRHVLFPTPIIDVGASYFGGPISYTNKRVETPVIDCSGKKFIQLSFTYIQGGIPGNDFCDIEYSGDGGATWNFLTTMAQTNNSTCGLQGLWSFYSVGLPAALSNNNNVKLGFHWYSNDATGGSPSVAIDEMRLSEATGFISSPVDCATPTASVVITNTAIGNTSFTWASVPAVNFSAVNGGSANVTFPAMGTYSLYCYGSSASSVAATSTAEIVSIVDFVSTNSVSIASSNSLICEGSTAILTASGASSYTWNTSSNSTSIVVSPSVNTQYVVTGVIGACISTFSFTQLVDPCTAMSESTHSNEFAAFPNPFSSELNFASNDEIEICITNIVGHIVKKSVFHRKGSIDTSEFPNGIYYVSFKTEKETKVLKLVRN
ncbi:MAG: T9SS type A sorting domain-containing protein [Bacteroidia bacterium]|nr:T9SS type A sorting domain-containing protein [Sphingobacteriaceae bacterium]MBP9068990.1 T9SS type A sorting domain-containing protein [Bacteroidia bacterium]